MLGKGVKMELHREKVLRRVPCRVRKRIGKGSVWLEPPQVLGLGNPDNVALIPYLKT